MTSTVQPHFWLTRRVFVSVSVEWLWELLWNSIPPPTVRVRPERSCWSMAKVSTEMRIFTYQPNWGSLGFQAYYRRGSLSAQYWYSRSQKKRDRKLILALAVHQCSSDFLNRWMRQYCYSSLLFFGPLISQCNVLAKGIFLLGSLYGESIKRRSGKKKKPPTLSVIGRGEGAYHCEMCQNVRHV